MWQAVTQAIRQIRRQPRLSIAVAAIMAICIGSSVAIFCMVKAVLLTDWGYSNPDRIALLWHARPNVAGVVGVSPGDFVSYRSSLQLSEAVAAVTTRGFNLGGEAAARITCARMTDGMFPLLGVAPARGRWLTAEDDRDAARVAVISHRLWTTRLGGQGDPIDRELLLDAVQHRIVGVMPASFDFPPEGIQGLAAAECWVPASFTPAELAIPAFNYVLLTRLKAGVSLEQASADAHAGAQRIWSTYPAAVQSQVQLTARVVPLAEQARARSRTPLALFAAAVFGLLIIGCANVSNLMLTSAESRRGELAVRASLGASRFALRSQLLAESIVVCVLGGLAGVSLAAALLAAMIATNASAFPGLGDARIDPSAVLVAVICGIVAGAAGAWPAALRLSTDGQATGLRASARSLGGGLRGMLIATELALAVIVLALAGVLARSVTSLNDIKPGFIANDLTTFSVALPEAGHRDRQSLLNFSEEILRRLRSIPSVSAAAAASAPPIGEATPGVVFVPATAGAPEYKPSVVHAVTPGYEDAIGLAVREGRFVAATDVANAMTVAVLNDTLARTLFPEGLALGRTFHRIGSSKPHTVVGVVADVKQAGPQRPALPAVYLPFAQIDQPGRVLNFSIRSQLPIATLSRQVRAAVADVDADVPPFALRTGADLLSGAIASQRFNMLVVGVFAVFAVTLALGGLYAVLAHAVQQTRRDFGVRQALGATGVRIVGAVAGRAATPIIAGVAAGTVAAIAASGLIASLLFGVRPGDPATLAAAAGFVLAASIIAVWIPAQRATRVDLVTLLRHD
jgi:putative ABC transport system permease protein